MVALLVLLWVSLLWVACRKVHHERFGRRSKCLAGRKCLSEAARRCGTGEGVPEGARFLCGSPLSGTVYGDPEENPGMGWVI